MLGNCTMVRSDYKCTNCITIIQQHWLLTGKGLENRACDRSTNGADLSTLKQLDTVLETWAFMEASESRYMPGSRTDLTDCTTRVPMESGGNAYCVRVLNRSLLTFHLVDLQLKFNETEVGKLVLPLCHFSGFCLVRSASQLVLMELRSKRR